MIRLIKFLIFAPTALVLIALSVANRQVVTFSLDPFNADAPAISFDVPLYWLIFAGVALGLILGGTVVWLKQGRFRREAREQKYAAASARNEATALKEQARQLAKNALPAPR